ncbi:hypothetical protein CBR_g4718 [Chara braunii]|uniref:RNA-directed DNA polymerase n=1 Tax=Chara braunii TaxID=69332 RepID=A0A388KIL0_CHABU|nr:hypothetical protein CBR_g4718 [Chara braunii]|eukprot:GBG69890.1 hypothetical protein CBR_g4718 [Chara braunii]
MRYVLHSHHQEVGRVVDAANGSWARFRDLMLRKYRLGDGLLTMADLEAMKKEDFSTIGAFVHEFKKKARKVHGISEEAQCVTFLGLLSGTEASELTKHGERSEKLTWATVDKGVEEGSLDQVEQHQMRLQRRKRKERDATASGTPGVKRIVTDVLAAKKYAVRLEEGFDVERMMDKLLEGHNDLMNLKDILASAPRLRGELKGRLSWRLVPNVHLSTILPREIEWTEAGTRMEWKCVACGLVDLKVMDQPSIAMVNTGVEMNIIQERDVTMLGMEVDHSDHGVLHGANCKAIFCGTVSNVMVEIGRVRERMCFFVMPDVDHPILLGRSFLCRTKTLVFNRYEGTMILALSDPACKNYEIIKCRNTGPGSGRNMLNLGSFTFEESEYARRRLREEQEEEETVEVLSLSPNDVNEAMEVVAAHDMADPEAIKALREQVLGLLEEHNLTASGPKSKHCMREATILGFVCNEKGRRPDVKKTDKILERPVPFQSITDMRNFLGTCGFWRSFVKDFATKMEQLRKLVRQDQEWVWGEDQEKAVERMKGQFKEGGLVLGAPNYEATEDKPFVVETDVGPTALGGVLIQADVDGKERPLRFESRTLNMTERNYSQFKKETLAVLHCLRTFRNYIFNRRLILRVDPTALACSLKSYTPSDPTIARWLTYIWMFNFELERIPGDKNRADGLSRINWDGANQESIEDTPPVDGFLDQEEDVRLYINEWSLGVPSCVTHPIWLAPKGYERREESVLKPFQEEDPWGSKDVGWMMELALAGTHNLAVEVRMIEEGPTQVEKHEQLMGGMYLLTNTLLQGDFDRRGSLNPVEGEGPVPESQDDEFEEGEIKDAFRAEEYDGIYLELGLLLSCEMRDRDAGAKAQKMRHLYVVRDDHLFIKRQVGNPKRIVCGRNRQIDIIAALHDGIARGHKGIGATCSKISELYHWDGMLTMVIKYCQSCVPCQERSAQRPREPLHPRLETEVGAVVHLDLLFMPVVEAGSNYIFDARDNLTGFVDGWAIRTKTDPVLTRCIEEYYLRYPFVREFVMDRGSEFTCNEVRTLLAGYGMVANYTTVVHPQANAPVERGYSTITNLLAKWIEGRPNQWPKFLRAAFFEENVTVKRTTKSDFSKAAMQRGGRDARPRQGPQRISGRGEQHGPPRREPTPEFDDDNIELFLDVYRDHGAQRGWSVAERIHHLRGIGRFEEPVAQICEEVLTWTDVEAGMQRLRASPRGRDGMPIRLEEGNAEEFIPAYEHYMLIEFRRITSEELRPPSPSPLGQEPDIPGETPFRTLATHLDVSRWEAYRLGEGSTESARYVPLEEPLDLETETDMRDREEPQGPEMAAEQLDPVRPQVEEVITVGDDTPPCTPAPEPAQQSWPEEVPEPDSEEVLELSPETATIPEQEAEMEDQGACERARMEVLLDLPLATHATESPVIGGPAPVESLPALPCASERVRAEAPTPEGQGPRVERAPRETREEKSARVRARLDEIHARQAEMEAAGIKPTPPVEPKTTEQRIDKLWARYESQRDAARRRSREAGQADEGVDALREMGDLGFSATRMAIDLVDRKMREVAVTSFQRYSLLSDELTVRRLEVEHLTTQLAEERARRQAREVEWERRFREMAAVVDRLSAAGEAGQAERASVKVQGREARVSPGQGVAAESPRQGGPIEEVPLDSAKEEGGAQESLMAMSMKRRGSRLHELAAAMGIGTPQERPQRLDTPKYAPGLGELRAELGSWATGMDSG